MSEQQRRAGDAMQVRCEHAGLELAKLHAGDDPGLRRTWRVLAALVAETLRVERVGIWLLVDQGRAIRCEHLYQVSGREVFEGAVLRAQDFPQYFAAMNERRTIAIDAARDSPITAALKEPYLDPLGIVAMLDAPIYREGRIAGVICHEHTDAPRKWTEVECAFAAAVADNVARLFEEAARQQAQSSLNAYERHMLELHRMEAIGRMAAGIAHDFRGVLGAILGFAELTLRVPNLPTPARRNTQRIVEAATRGQELTREVTDFVRERPARPSILDVPHIVQAMVPMLRSLVGRDFHLTSNLDASVGRIFMDATQLERTILNLVVNARDAMPGGGTIEIDVREVSLQSKSGADASNFVRLAIVDRGIGMDAATLERARQPLFTTKGDKGTGLGLAIVDQIVTRAGGQMEIQSEPGSGTTVELLLPRIAAARNVAA